MIRFDTALPGWINVEPRRDSVGDFADDSRPHRLGFNRVALILVATALDGPGMECRR